MNDSEQTDQHCRNVSHAQLAACGCGGAENCDCADAIVCMRGVSFAYGSDLVLQDITFCVPRECLVGIIGPNGGGKTTLLKVILGLIEPQAGRVDVLGRRAGRLGRMRSEIGYVPQRARISWHFPATVRDVVISGCFGQLGVLDRPSPRRMDRAEELIELAGVSQYVDRPIGELSVGQQQRVLIARALVADPKLLIVDEPISGVDTVGQTQFFELIDTMRRDMRLTIIMVSHDIGQLASHTDYLACLNRTLHWHDPKEGIDTELIEQVYGCELRAHLDRRAGAK